MNYCTYFDHRYLPRFLVLWESLRRFEPSAHFTCLALDDAARGALKALQLPDVEVIGLEDLISFEPRLLAAQPDRTLVEFYFTCSPVLPLWVLDVRGVEMVTYLDADLYFLSSPAQLYDELAEASVGIISHRFPVDRPQDWQWGTYNVGWMAFRSDHRARAVLHRWRDQCIEWCRDVAEPDGRFADQGYLNDWPSAHAGVRVIASPGANLAPWNVRRHALSDEGSALKADGVPVTFFHVQGLRAVGARHYRLGLEAYGARGNRALRGYVYRPYITALRAMERRVLAETGLSPVRPLRDSTGTAGVRRRLHIARSFLRGDLLKARL
jgi:hypothetical protein